MAWNRSRVEYAEFRRDPPCPDCSAVQVFDELQWWVNIGGPDDTPYQDKHFRLEIKFPIDYPASPPEVKFVTKIYHPNIEIPENGGRVDLDILRDKWSAGLTVKIVLERILLLMKSPNVGSNPDDEFNPEAAEMYKTDRSRFDELARECGMDP